MPLSDKTRNGGGLYYEEWVDQIYGTGSGSRVVPVLTSSDGLSGVYTTVGNYAVSNAFRYVHIANAGKTYEVRKDRVTSAGRKYNYFRTGDNGLDGSFFAFADPGSYNTALSKLCELIRGDVDLSIDAYQYKQTASLIKKIFSVRKIVSELALRSFRIDESSKRRRYSTVTRKRVYAKRRDGRDRHKPFRTAAVDHPMKRVGGLHLEFTYGIKPTLQTIYDICNQRMNRYGSAIHIRKPGSKHAGVSASLRVEREFVYKDQGSIQVDKYACNFRTKFGGYYVPSGKALESISRWTSLNPASIVWENLPFSFVFDWFYDVGGYMRNLETALISRLGTFEGYVTATKRESTSQQITLFGKSGLDNQTGSATESKYRQHMNRQRLTAVPVPRPPRFRTDLSSGRLINAAALLSQFLKTRR